MSEHTGYRVASVVDKRVTLPSELNVAKGYPFISDMENIPSRIYTQIFDIDIASGYPTSGVIANISKETCLREICGFIGLDRKEGQDLVRVAGVNMTATRTNAIELAQTLYKAPTMEDSLAKFMRDCS